MNSSCCTTTHCSFNEATLRKRGGHYYGGIGGATCGTECGVSYCFWTTDGDNYGERKRGGTHFKGYATFSESWQ